VISLAAKIFEQMFNKYL